MVMCFLVLCWLCHVCVPSEVDFSSTMPVSYLARAMILILFITMITWRSLYVYWHLLNSTCLRAVDKILNVFAETFIVKLCSNQICIIAIIILPKIMLVCKIGSRKFIRTLMWNVSNHEIFWKQFIFYKTVHHAWQTCMWRQYEQNILFPSYDNR